MLAIGGIGSIIGGGYLVRRRRTTHQPEQGSLEASSGESAATPTTDAAHPTEATKQIESDDVSPVEAHQSEAETALEAAVTATKKNDLRKAADSYSTALAAYQAALGALDDGATETHTELEQAIDATREELEAVETKHEQQKSVLEALTPAERNFQEPLIAYSEDRQTVAKISFRQARNRFREALNSLADGDVDPLLSGLEVTVEPSLHPTSTTIAELAVISDAATAELGEKGVDAITDLEADDEEPWRPAPVADLVADDHLSEAEATKLTLLSWYHDGSYEFNTVAAIERRREQAEYGFRKSL